jgi:hypothetical protein
MNHGNQATIAGTSLPVLDEVVSTTRPRWLLLATGAAWIVIATVILRFDYTTALAGSRAPGWWLLPVVGLAELAIGGSPPGRYCTALARSPRRS